jgi:hypothetical protein
MGMAVLLGKSIYNIGELLEKQILKALVGTEFEWLYDILQTFDGGKIIEFEHALGKHQEALARMPMITKNENLLKSKVRILAFLELVFHREKGDRNLTFDLIAQTADIPKEDVRA